MGVSYEVDPQSNLGWLTQKLDGLSRRIETLEGTLRQGTGRTGPVTGSPLIVSPHAANGVQELIRRGSVVYCALRIIAGGAIAADGIVATLPAGFRLAPTANQRFSAGARYSGAWTTQQFYMNTDGTVRLLSNGCASGDLLSVSLVPFIAGA